MRWPIGLAAVALASCKQTADPIVDKPAKGSAIAADATTDPEAALREQMDARLAAVKRVMPTGVAVRRDAGVRRTPPIREGGFDVQLEVAPVSREAHRAWCAALEIPMFKEHEGSNGELGELGSCIHQDGPCTRSISLFAGNIATYMEMCDQPKPR